MHTLANVLAGIAALLILLDMVLWFGTGTRREGGYTRHVLLQIGCFILAVAVVIGAPGFVN